MAPSLKDLPFEEKNFRLKLSTLKKRKERGDFRAVYRALKGLEKIEGSSLCEGQQKYKRTREETEKDYMQERHKKNTASHIEAWKPEINLMQK